ncbi:acyltransferase [Chloroflexi bacterium CFX6]|nr:acyltransferase [Chloroflexi bacterium CFX6]
MNAKTIQRRYDLDWLRVLGILLVFFFHSSRFYNVEDWNIKNNIWYPSVEVWVGFSSSFMMPLMFAISGASLFYALGKGGFGKFVKDKVLRLLVPLLVGALTHLSLQSYQWDKTHGLFSGNYFQYLPHYYPNSINWFGGHLWYLWYLFLFSLILYPLMRWMKGDGLRFLSRLDGWLSKTGVLYTLMLPPFLLFVVVGADSPLMEGNGGYPYIAYLWILLLGFLIVSGERVQEKIRQLRWVSLSVGLAMVIGFCVLYTLTADKDTVSLNLILAVVLRVFGGWICILGFFGLAAQYLTAPKPGLNYANEAVLPFYIFHQTVLLAVGYFVLQWGLPDVLEWAIIVVISFAAIMALYEFAVRRFNVMRFLFGMKLLDRASIARAMNVKVTRTARP